MKTYLKAAAFSLGIIAAGFIYSASALPTLFTFTLAVKDVSNPQIFVGRDKRQHLPSEPNVFKINVKQSDYYFKVHYQHKGKNKEAVCLISGAPEYVTAIINPQKDGRDACITQESSRGSIL